MNGSDHSRLDRLLQDDPSLVADLLRWAESARSLGTDGVFAAYRHVDRVTDDAETGPLVVRRTCGSQQAANRLYHANNVHVLRALLDEGVPARCAYIDPPYGTRQQFARKATGHAAYCDGASGASYLENLRARLILLRELLDAEGTLFIHLDASMVAEVKLLLDELFGMTNFRAWITRRKCSSKNYTRKSFGDITDYVLFYSKSARYVFNRQFEQRSSEQEKIDFPKLDATSGRRFALVPLHAPGKRNGATGEEWREMKPPPGKHWQWAPERLDEFDARGDIYWTRNGTPRRKIWADESPGASVANMWHDFRDPFNQNFTITGYPTEKNVDLLRRVVSAASNPGDVVIDCYAGSGTTLDAAGSLGRRWIGIDNSDLAIGLAQRRLAELALYDDSPGDVTRDFELRCGSPVTSRVPALAGEVEFAFLERVDEVRAPEICEVLKPAEIPLRIEGLGSDEHLVAFDHGGRERSYGDLDSIQSTEKRPA